MACKAPRWVCTLLLAASQLANARSSYKSKIPNALLVTDCNGAAHRGVGHINAGGGGARNPFGSDFEAAGKQWTASLCAQDSDGDGLTNGEELGDPNCVWTEGDTPEVTTGITHPGFDCSSSSSTPSAPSSGGGSSTTGLFAHGILMLFACAFLFPVGAQVPLFWRSAFAKWFKLHFYIQMGGIVVLLVGLVLALTSVSSSHFSPNSVGAHKLLGLLTILLFLGQMCLGLLRPHREADGPEAGGKATGGGTRRFAWLTTHRLVALSAICLSIVQCVTGPMALRDTYGSGSSGALVTLFAALLGVSCVIALVGACRKRKPLTTYASFVARRPCLVFTVGLVAILGLAIVGVLLLLLGGTEIDGGTSKFTTVGSAITGRERALDYSWIESASSSTSALSSGSNNGRRLYYHHQPTLELDIYYESTDGSANLLDGAKALKIAAAERALLDSYAARWGHAHGLGSMSTTKEKIDAVLQSPPESPAALFMQHDASDWYYSGALRADHASLLGAMAEHVKETQLAEAYSHERRFCAESRSPDSVHADDACLGSVQPHVASSFSSCSPTSPVLRTKMRFVLNGGGALTEAIGFLQDATSSAEESLLSGEIYMRWKANADGEDLTDVHQNAIVMTDAIVSLIAVVTVFVLLAFNTRLLFTSFMGWLTIILCFPIAFVPYYAFLGVRWMGILNLMTLFLIFGIGADDIFVLKAMWDQSARHHAHDDYEKRLGEALPHATQTMLATSLTTAVAFLANAVSLIPPLKLYGILAGFEVIVLFLCVILWFPSVLVIQESRFGGGCCCKPKEPLPKESEATPERRSSTLLVRLSTQFTSKWPGWLWRGSPLLLPVSVGFIATCIALVPHLKPASEQPSLWKVGHNHFEAAEISLLIGKDSLAPEVAPVDIVWGLLPRDQRALDPADEPCGVQSWDRYSGEGSTCASFWDPLFDLSSELAQEHVIDVCDRLLSEPAYARNFPAIECPMYAFRDYLRVLNHTFPVPQADFGTRLGEWLDACQNGMAPSSSSCALGSTQTNPVYEERVKAYTDLSGNKKLAFLIVRIYATLTTTMNPLELKTHHDWWEAFVADANSRAPPGVTNGFQYFRGYNLMETLLNLLQSGFTATLLSCALAFVVLMVASGDLVVGLLAFLCVLSVVLSVIGLIVITGSSLGIIESICLSILVGLSVDYVVHVGVAYTTAPSHLDRRERASHAVGTIGGAVVAGALTTLSCTIFLFPTTLSFFGIFGRFILAVCISGCIVSLGVFPMLLMHFGTQSDACKPHKWSIFRAPNAQVSSASTTATTVSAASCSSSADAAESLPASPPPSPPTADGKAATFAPMPPAAFMGRLPFRCSFGLVLFGIFAGGLVAAIVAAPGSSAAASSTSACSAAGTYRLTFSDYLVANESDSYVCQQMTLPTDCAYHVTKMTPIESTPMTHHMILFSVINNLGSCAVSCFDMPGQVSIIWAWAIGGGAFELPSDVGLRIGADSSHMLSTLQMHYNNPEGQPGVLDSSGVELELTPVLREKEMVMMMSGAPPSNIIAIPPRQSAYVLEVEVPLKIVAPVTAFKFALHAHQTGIRLAAHLIRDGQVVAGLGSEDPYFFDFQTFRDFPDPGGVTMQPGDRLRLRCVFDTLAHDSCTYGGDRSNQEMCLQFMAAYPAEAVTDYGSIESQMDEYISDPVDAWEALRGHDEWSWPEWVRDLKNNAGLPACTASDVDGYACTHTMMPGFTLHWNATTVGSDSTIVGLVRLDSTASATPAWVALGVSPGVQGSMIGSWAIIGQPADGSTAASVGLYDLNGKAASMVTPSSDTTRLLSSGISVVSGVTEMAFVATMGTDAGDFATSGLTTLLAAHGQGSAALAYHGSHKAHASVELVASPSSAASIGLRASGDPAYNPCFAH